MKQTDINKYLKRIIGIFMVLVLLCGHGNVYAALEEGGENGSGSSMGFGDFFSAQEISTYRSSDVYTYPEKEGYVFAGWFTDTSYKTAISKDTRKGKYFPKFVDEEVLTIRYQLTEETDFQSSKTNLRLITSVDNLKYESIGFTINGTEILSDTVYGAIKGYTKDGVNNYIPSEVFHGTSSFFATYTLTDALNTIDHHGTGDDFGLTVEVVPQWTTKDGTTVEGKRASFEINDTLYDSELYGSAHLWGTLAENVNSASASTVNATIDMLRDGTVTATSSSAATLSAGDDVTVTVNGNGKTVTTSGTSDIFKIESNIEWKDLTIFHSGSASLFTLNDSCDFTLNNVNIVGDATSVDAESAIIRTGEHCTGSHVSETFKDIERTITGSTEKTDSIQVSTDGSLVEQEQDKTVNIRISNGSMNTKSSSGTAGIRVMRGTIAHINFTDSIIDTKDTLPVYVTGIDEDYHTWRGMAYITADSESVFTQGGVSLTTSDIKTNNEGMVALNEYTNRVIILADTHWMPEEAEKGNYTLHEDVAGLSLGHTQGDRMRNIYLDIKYFSKRQNVDSVLVLGDLSNDDYPVNKIGINADGTFSDITKNYVYKFKNNLMTKFQSEMGIASSWALPGNHDSYTNDQWKQIMGYDRQYAIEIGNAVFVMLDTYEADGVSTKSEYRGVDIDWLRAQLDANPSWIGKPIFLCNHYYKQNTDDSNLLASNTIAVQELLTEYEALGYQFVSMFYGHIHKTATRYVFSGKKMPILVAGGYAYNTDSQDYDAFYDHSAWGFGVLEWNDHEAHYYHVKYDRTYVSTAEDLVTDSIVSYGGAIENEIFLTY